ncbi:hypothetical protein GQ457_08G017310 [Hibiscus cannabinus]
MGGIQRVTSVEKVGQEITRADGSDNGPIVVSSNCSGPEVKIGVGFKEKDGDFKISWANMLDKTFNSGKGFNLSGHGKAMSDGENKKDYFAELEARKGKKRGKEIKKKVGSLLELQNNSITACERRKRDKALRSRKWSKQFLEETELSGKSLSDSDIKSRVSILVKEAKQLLNLEYDYNIGAENDPESFSQAMSYNESKLWYDAMKDEMNSMENNVFRGIVSLSNGVKAIGYSLRIVLALVAQFDLELQKNDVKAGFLNGVLEVEVYMKQPEGFSSSDGQNLSDIVFCEVQEQDFLLEKDVNQENSVRKHGPSKPRAGDVFSQQTLLRKKVTCFVEEETLWKLQKFLVGYTASDCDPNRIHDRLCPWGLGEIKVKRMVCRLFLLEIEDNLLYNFLKDSGCSYLLEIFMEIQPWTNSFRIPYRVVWLELTGVPLHCWNHQTFKRIAEAWGVFLFLGENALQSFGLEKLSMVISTIQFGKIEAVINLEVGNELFPVRISEIPSSEEKHDVCPKTYKGKACCEYGISSKSSSSCSSGENFDQVESPATKSFNLKRLLKRRKRKRYGSLRDFQDRVLTEAEKKRRDGHLRIIKKKIIEDAALEIDVTPISSSVLRHKKEILIRDARSTIEFGKQLGFEVKGDLQEAILDMARLNEFQA